MNLTMTAVPQDPRKVARKGRPPRRRPPRRPRPVRRGKSVGVAGPEQAQNYAFAVLENRGMMTLTGPRGFPVLERFWAEMDIEGGLTGDGDDDTLTSVQSGWTVGPGFWLCELANGSLALELRFKRCANPAGVLVTVTVRNRGPEAVRVSEIRLARTVMERPPERWGDPAKWRLLRYWHPFAEGGHEDEDRRPGSLEELAATRVRMRSVGAAALALGPGPAGSPAGSPAGILAGFVTSDRQAGWLDFRREGREMEISASCETRGTALAPGGTLESETLYLGVHPDLRTALAEFGGMCGRRAGSAPRSAPTGWMPAAAGTPEGELVENARFISGRREALPLGAVVTGPRWEKAAGDWEDGGKDLPRGPAWFVERAMEAGLAPGLVISPFLAAPGSRLAKEHPDWMVRDAAGKPLNVETGTGEARESWFAVDGLNPGAREWLEGLFRGFREKGVGVFVLDRLFAGLVRGARAGEGTRVEAFRGGLAAIRRGAGDAYLLGRDVPWAPAAGLLDGLEAGPGRDDLHRKFWMHRALWNVEPPPFPVGTGEEAAEEGRAALASASLSGGALFLADRLSSLPAERLDAARAALMDRAVAAAVPLDLFERAAPRMLLQPLGGGRFRLGVLNPGNLPRSPLFELSAAGMARARITAVRDGREVPLGAYRRRFLVPPVPARGASLFILEAA